MILVKLLLLFACQELVLVETIDVLKGYSLLDKLLLKNFKSNSLCNRQLNHFQENLEWKTLWARKLRDSWGSFPAGTFSGNLYDFGNFDQCVGFHHLSNEVGEILGQHCTLLIPFDRDDESDQKLLPPTRNSETNVGIGICLPASCHPNQVKKIADELLKADFNVTTSPDDQSNFCSTAQKSLEFNVLQIFAM